MNRNAFAVLALLSLAPPAMASASPPLPAADGAVTLPVDLSRPLTVEVAIRTGQAETDLGAMAQALMEAGFEPAVDVLETPAGETSRITTTLRGTRTGHFSTDALNALGRRLGKLSEGMDAKIEWSYIQALPAGTALP